MYPYKYKNREEWIDNTNPKRAPAPDMEVQASCASCYLHITFKDGSVSCIGYEVDYDSMYKAINWVCEHYGE